MQSLIDLVRKALWTAGQWRKYRFAVSIESSKKKPVLYSYGLDGSKVLFPAMVLRAENICVWSIDLLYR